MHDYKRITTSAEVCAVIRARHPELKVFGTLSQPDGDSFGDTSQGRMYTSYGFEQSDYPIIAAQVEWDIDREEPSARNNETHRYWLCVPVVDD